MLRHWAYLFYSQSFQLFFPMSLALGKLSWNASIRDRTPLGRKLLPQKEGGRSPSPSPSPPYWKGPVHCTEMKFPQQQLSHPLPFVESSH